MKIKLVGAMCVVFAILLAASNVAGATVVPTIFTYHLIFTKSDIPPPNSSSFVHSIYSPYVVYAQNKHYMFFGVSLMCNNGSAYRDSVAYATSEDGVSKWKFKGYVVEPDPRVCTTPIASWPQGMLYQVNDPTVIFQQNVFYVSYTAVKWKTPSTAWECGSIGTTIFDVNMQLIFRNDDYLVPQQSQCTSNYRGFSRPAYRRLAPGSHELWFDSSGTQVSVKKIPLTSVTQLNASSVSDVLQAPAQDVDVQDTVDGETFLFYNGPVITYRKFYNGSWTGPQSLTSPSNYIDPAWDSGGQGSLHYFVNRTNCTSNLYMSGTVFSSPGVYDSLSIGVAIPRNGDLGAKICQLP